MVEAALTGALIGKRSAALVTCKVEPHKRGAQTLATITIAARTSWGSTLKSGYRSLKCRDLGQVAIVGGSWSFQHAHALLHTGGIMSTGRARYLTKQAGEYLAAAELCRRGLVATTFTGNLPYYDIIATDGSGRHVVVQVKAIAGPNWQFRITQFVEVRFDGDRQILGKPAQVPLPDLVCIFVSVAQYGRDRFFILTWKDLQEHMIRGHQAYLDAHGGRRPRKPRSLHTAVSPDDLTAFEDNWDLIRQSLRALA